MVVHTCAGPSTSVSARVYKHPQVYTAGTPTCTHTCTRTPTHMSTLQAAHTHSWVIYIYTCTHIHTSLLRVHTHVVAVPSPGHVQFFMTPWTAAHQASLSFTISQSLLRLMSTESVMPSNPLVLYHPLILPSIFPSCRVVSSEWALCIRWPMYWSFSTFKHRYSLLATPTQCPGPGLKAWKRLNEKIQGIWTESCLSPILPGWFWVDT